MAELPKPGVKKVTRRAKAPAAAAATSDVSGAGAAAAAGAGRKAAATPAAHRSQAARRGAAPDELGAVEEKTKLRQPSVAKVTRRAGAPDAAKAGGVSGVGAAATAGAGRKVAATPAAHRSETTRRHAAPEVSGAADELPAVDRRMEGVPPTGSRNGPVREPKTTIASGDPDGTGSLGGGQPAVPRLDEVRMSRMRQVALYGGIVALGVLEVVEWPAAVALGVGAYLFGRVGVDRRAAGPGVAEPGNAGKSSR